MKNKKVKKISAIIISIALVLSFAACQKSATTEETPDSTTTAAETTTEETTVKELTPMEKLENHIIENGKESDGTYVLEYPEIVDKIAQSDFTIANMSNLKASAVTEFKLVKGDDGITLELLDSSITDNGIKMSRSISLKPDGTFEFHNNLIMNGIDMGLYFEGEILPATYTKEIIPVIAKTELAPGAQLNDASKELL